MLCPHRDMLLSTWILLDYRIIQMSRASEQVGMAADYSFHRDLLKAVFPITSASSGPYTIHHSTGTHTLLTEVKLRHSETYHTAQRKNSTKFETLHSPCTNSNECCRVPTSAQKQHCQLHRGTHFLNTFFQISRTAPIYCR